MKNAKGHGSDKRGGGGARGGLRGTPGRNRFIHRTISGTADTPVDYARESLPAMTSHKHRQLAVENQVKANQFRAQGNKKLAAGHQAVADAHTQAYNATNPRDR